MFGNRTLNRLERMLEDALAGRFEESNYDETKLSRLETKWKYFLGTSVLLKENLEREKENIKSLVSDISHQTKTPMANIKLYTALLKEKLESEGDSRNLPCSEDREQMLKMAEEICVQTEKLDFLIHSLTKMSRLESNIVEVKPVSQQVSILVQEAVSDILPKAQDKGIGIAVCCEDTGEAVYDRKWTKEALGNVLDNAVKYSPPESTVKVTVTEYQMYTGIAVKDEGIGIREGESSKIFGRFCRLPEVQQEDGVGIGLYLTREILRKENGYIKVKSKEGQGSEFTLFLPRN